MGNVFKKIAGFGKDVVNLSVQPFVTAYNSVTGKDVQLEYETKVVDKVAGLSEKINVSINVVAKKWADSITGGYATKAVNLIRKDEYKEIAGKYNEAKDSFFKIASNVVSVPVDTLNEILTPEIKAGVRKYWWVGLIVFFVWLIKK